MSLIINNIKLDLSHLLSLLQKEYKLAVIKYVKTQTGLGLKECKYIVERLEKDPNSFIKKGELPVMEYTSPRPEVKSKPKRRKGNHVIDQSNSKSLKLIIFVLLVVIALLSYFLLKK